MVEIKRIIDLCKEHGIPEPTWVDNHGFISICFFKSKEAFLHNVIKELTERQRFILDDVIKDTTITVSQLAKNSNVTERTIMRDIDTLQKAGILHREGGRKDGHWAICSRKSLNSKLTACRTFKADRRFVIAEGFSVKIIWMRR